MKIAVSAMGGSLEAQVSEKFGRAPYFIIVDTDTMKFTPVMNNASSMSGGAGPEAVRQVSSHGVSAVLTGQLGPNAQNALAAAKITAVTGISGTKTVRQAAEEYAKK
ncbi:MAG TPA: NifB/NifX family molybdenum-iron cluster-binding protein [Elusimicrobiales bacterium]|nr:NifB/NifX family molybdenum-iron cluster-binding protein [Elusimicrobiales bacterium]